MQRRVLRSLRVVVAMVIALSVLINITPVESRAAIKEEEEVSPLFSYTSSVSTSLGIVDGDAICRTSVYGYSAVATKVTITQTLQKKSGSSWVKVWSWTNTNYNWYYEYVNYHYPLTAGTTYRVKSEIKVYSGTSYETIYSYSNECYYGG